MSRRIHLALALAVALLVVVAVPYCGRWWRIDKCLDAGGAWDEGADQCVFHEAVMPGP